MKLKSIFAILAAGVLACTGLTACGDAASSGEKKTFTVGFDQDFPPFGYVDENGVWDGNERRVRSDENLSIYRG